MLLNPRYTLSGTSLYSPFGGGLCNDYYGFGSGLGYGGGLGYSRLYGGGVGLGGYGYGVGSMTSLAGCGYGYGAGGLGYANPAAMLGGGLGAGLGMATAGVGTAYVASTRPFFTCCPYCANQVTTVCRKRIGAATIVWACILSVCCLWWVPFCSRKFKDIVHYCSCCGQQIGVYRRF